MKTIRTIFALVILLFLMQACEKSATENPITKHENVSSISLENGNYKIDTNVVNKNWNIEPFLTLLKTENFTDKENVSYMPDFIKAFLDSLSPNKNFDIANPGENWRIGSIIDFSYQTESNLPTKQLVYLGIGKNMVLLSYYTGGLRRQQHISMIKFKDKKISDFWFTQFGPDVNLNYLFTKAGLIEKVKEAKRGGNEGC